MKRFVVILLFNKNIDKVLLIKRNKKPYAGCYNGVGGKIEEGETIKEAAIRETFEETGIKLNTIKHLVSHIYPENINFANSDIELNVFYEIVDEKIELQEIKENYEGVFEWKKLEFAADFNNNKMAGYGNVALFIREILDLENVGKKFYNN